eukprot:9523999-Alexandrium_andersonii.AAC.1
MYDAACWGDQELGSRVGLRSSGSGALGRVGRGGVLMLTTGIPVVGVLAEVAAGPSEAGREDALGR